MIKGYQYTVRGILSKNKTGIIHNNEFDLKISRERYIGNLEKISYN